MNTEQYLLDSGDSIYDICDEHYNKNEKLNIQMERINKVKYIDYQENIIQFVLLQY